MTSLLALLFLACEREVSLNVEITDERTPIETTGVAELDPIPEELQAIMDARCMRCHSDWGDDSETILDSLERLDLVVAGAPDESLFYLKLFENPTYGYQMPRQYSAINPQLIDNIERWIRLGAMRNDSFDAQVVPPYQGFCADCHPEFTDGSNHPDAIYEALLNLEFNGMRFVEPSAPESSLFYLKITDPPYGEQMPVSFPVLSEAERQLVFDWLAGG